MTEEEDMMIEECQMKGEVIEGGHVHTVQEVLAGSVEGPEVQGTEEGQGHGVGHVPDPDQDRGRGASQGHDQEKEEVNRLRNYISILCNSLSYACKSKIFAFGICFSFTNLPYKFYC